MATNAISMLSVDGTEADAIKYQRYSNVQSNSNLGPISGITTHDQMENTNRLIGLVVRIPKISMLPRANDGKVMIINYKVCVF